MCNVYETGSKQILTLISLIDCTYKLYSCVCNGANLNSASVSGISLSFLCIFEHIGGWYVAAELNVLQS